MKRVLWTKLSCYALGVVMATSGMGVTSFAADSVVSDGYQLMDETQDLTTTVGTYQATGALSNFLFLNNDGGDLSDLVDDKVIVDVVEDEDGNLSYEVYLTIRSGSPKSGTTFADYGPWNGQSITQILNRPAASLYDEVEATMTYDNALAGVRTFKLTFSELPGSSGNGVTVKMVTGYTETQAVSYLRIDADSFINLDDADVDYTTLEETISGAEAVDTGDYSAASVETFEAALESAKEVATDLEVTQAEVDAATATLLDAYNQLTEKTTAEYKAELEEAQNALEEAKSALEEAQAKAEENQSELETTQSELEEAKSALKKAQAEAQAAKEALTAAQTTATQTQQAAVETQSTQETESATATAETLTKISLKKISAGTKKLTVSYKKASESVTGYEIEVSTSKNFTNKTTKTITVKGQKNTSKTVKKLKSGKKYYVRVRTYKTTNGTTTYSAWSAVKTAKTK